MFSQALQTKMDALRGASRKRNDLESTIINMENRNPKPIKKRLAELAETRLTGNTASKNHWFIFRKDD